MPGGGAVLVLTQDHLWTSGSLIAVRPRRAAAYRRLRVAQAILLAVMLAEACTGMLPETDVAAGGFLSGETAHGYSLVDIGCRCRRQLKPRRLDFGDDRVPLWLMRGCSGCR